MSQARKVVKYSAAGALSALYLLAIHRELTRTEPRPAVPPQRVAVTASLMAALTWMATLL